MNACLFPDLFSRYLNCHLYLSDKVFFIFLKNFQTYCTLICSLHTGQTMYLLYSFIPVCSTSVSDFVYSNTLSQFKYFILCLPYPIILIMIDSFLFLRLVVGVSSGVIRSCTDPHTLFSTHKILVLILFKLCENCL